MEAAKFARRVATSRTSHLSNLNAARRVASDARGFPSDREREGKEGCALKEHHTAPVSYFTRLEQALRRLDGLEPWLSHVRRVTRRHP